VVRASGY